MEQQAISNLFFALRDGEIRELNRIDGDLQFQVFLPKLADLQMEGSHSFLCCLGQVRAFSLQPFRNEGTEITDLKQINKLQLQIERAELREGGWVHVLCGIRGNTTGARLSIKASQMTVWDEAFDPVTVSQLGLLRGKAAGK